MAETFTGENRRGLIRDFAARLKHPQLFFLAASVFVIDLFVPDLIPFVDEILLGLLTVFLGRLRRPEPGPAGAAEPRVKNVTPPDQEPRR
ncbi:MAG: DUF6116 family protein [Acidobacteriota bacterium]